MEKNHICKKCGGIAGWDSYFGSWICTRCGNEEPKPITNYDRIKQAGNESEMASAFIDFLHTASCIGGYCNTPDKACHQCVLDWLRQEAE